MNPCELAVSITALAATIARCLSPEETALLAAVFNQLGDTLATIAAQESLQAAQCEAWQKRVSSTPL